jgi:hypothetical protein
MIMFNFEVADILSVIKILPFSMETYTRYSGGVQKKLTRPSPSHILYITYTETQKYCSTSGKLIKTNHNLESN